MALDEDYEHWQDDDMYSAEPAKASAGYDNHNGLRRHTYVNSQNAAAAVSQQPPIDHAQQPQMIAYQPVQYFNNAQPLCWPQQGFFAYVQPAQQIMFGPPQPSSPPGSCSGAAKHRGDIWMGRSKNEVAIDNMQLAARERANDRRKMAPVGVEDDAFLWVVEPDGTTILRAYADIKGLVGDWKQDPRYEDSWYFLRKSG